MKICANCKSQSLVYEFNSNGSRIDLCTDCGSLNRSVNEPVALLNKHSSAGFQHADLLKYFSNVTNKFVSELSIETVIVLAPFSELLVKTNNEFQININKSINNSLLLFKLNLLDNTFDLIDICQPLIADAIIFYKSVGHMLNSSQLVGDILNAIPDGADVYIVEPSLDSKLARMMGSRWSKFKSASKTFFSNESLKSWCYRNGLGEIRLLNYKSTPSIATIINSIFGYEMQRTPASFFRFLPGLLLNKQVSLNVNNVCYRSKKTVPSLVKKVSIVMPIYNEAKTIRFVIDRVISKKILSLEKELILVESNSTDGTRDIVNSYSNVSGIKIVLQDEARGKGNAVREGFQHCTGDIVLIQDGDDEYDIDDYEALIKPFLNFSNDFVLGARHGGKAWKMRTFDGQAHISHFLNLGHVFFSFLVNTFFGSNLKDPFTMYKVFRRDLITGLNFKCDRFDFDFELLIKLMKIGCVPREIPVNYNSRSFDDGKKVNVLRDPISWICAIIKLKVSND